MTGPELVVTQMVSEGLLQEALNKLVAGIGGGLVAWYGRKIYYERQSRNNKLEKTYRALFGVDDVDTIEGVVEIIEAHEEDIEELYNQVEKGKEKREEIERRVENIKERIVDRHESSGSSN